MKVFEEDEIANFLFVGPVPSFCKNVGISLANVMELRSSGGKGSLLRRDMLLFGKLIRGNHVFVFKYINANFKVRFKYNRLIIILFILSKNLGL